MDKIKEEVRLVIAVALAVIIIVIFGRFRPPQQPVPQQPKLEPQTISSEEVSPEQNLIPDLSPEKVGEEKIYEDNRYLIKYNTDGGMIKSIGIKKYIRKNETALNIFDGSDLLLTYSLDNLEDAYNPYSSAEKENSIYLQNITGNILIEKDVSIPSELHTFTAILKISNRGKNPEHLKNYILSAGTLNIVHFQTKSRGDREFSPPEILVKTNGNIQKVNIARTKKSAIYEKTEWIALKQRYGLIFLKPSSPLKGFVTASSDNSVKTGFLYDDLEILPGETKNIELSFYAGPSDYFVAKDEIKEKEIFGTGFFSAMGRFLFNGLYYIHRAVPNWGWSIIILTLIIKAVFFPLTLKSLRSMKALQKLRPYLQDIQKKYKNNPQQMQKELMNLYKEYKINPFGGCLPMFVQFPIFIGFFIALRSSVFLRGAPFIFWIKDLSVPDTIVRIAGFPLNLLPLIMAATSFLQQKLTPQEPSQKAMTYMMPVIFLVLFYNFSSGLLLYWTTMNLAGLIEQYYVHKK
ncbi:MAG: YidC/Oxa1 family insertase periplasmic-domain containing protein [Candidatus Omnitrophica bacterium]|nr:YidC/Oxa1 family insertase periplasmic-domain containing protein [Candidatus Omnitrophota bacterium]